MLNVKQALAKGRTKLNKTSTSSLLDAEVLLSFVIKKEREFLYAHPEYKLNLIQNFKYNKLITKRAKGIPVAYLLHKKEFYGLDFYVDENVLIPRPETELLVEEVIKNSKPEQTIADIGTGSGCIAITLAKNLPNKIIATDISNEALAVAKKNTKTLNASVEFYQGNLFEPLKDKKIDIIIANLPYGWKKWKNNTSAETKGLQFEPQVALFTKDNGLYLYQQLFEQIAKAKYQPKLIIGEYDPRQTEEMKNIVQKNLPQGKITIKKDLAGLDRFLIIKL